MRILSAVLVLTFAAAVCPLLLLGMLVDAPWCEGWWEAYREGAGW